MTPLDTLGGNLGNLGILLITLTSTTLPPLDTIVPPPCEDLRYWEPYETEEDTRYSCVNNRRTYHASV